MTSDQRILQQTKYTRTFCNESQVPVQALVLCVSHEQTCKHDIAQAPLRMTHTHTGLPSPDPCWPAPLTSCTVACGNRSMTAARVDASCRLPHAQRTPEMPPREAAMQWRRRPAREQG